MSNNWFRRNTPLVAFAILAIGTSVGFNLEAQHDDDQIRKANVESCERVNVLRESANADTRIIQAVLTEAAHRLREESELPGTTKQERTVKLKSAETFENLLKDTKIVPLTDCEAKFLGANG